MGKGIFFGVGSKARKVKKLYFGVGGKAKKVKRVYIGDASGKARLVWQDWQLPSYTGNYVIHGDETKGYIELKSSGSLTLSEGIYDVFAVGGGGGGSASTGAYGGGYTGGGGGGSGRTIYKCNINVSGSSYAIVIGTGGVCQTAGGSTSSALGAITADGGDALTLENNAYSRGASGGSGGGCGAQVVPGSDGSENQASAGASNGNNAASGGKGQGSTTRAFGETSNTLYAGGGGGGGCYRYNYSGQPGGAGGGGSGSSSGVGSVGGVNTGGGGGGAYRSSGGSGTAGGSGGSGIVIVRWGY